MEDNPAIQWEIHLLPENANYLAMTNVYKTGIFNEVKN